MNRHQHLSILYDIYCLMLFNYCIRLGAPFCSFPFAARARSAFGALKLAVLWLRCSATFAKRLSESCQTTQTEAPIHYLDVPAAGVSVAKFR